MYYPNELGVFRSDLQGVTRSLILLVIFVWNFGVWTPGAVIGLLLIPRGKLSAR